MVTASERKMYFHVWPGDDLRGAALGELTEATDKQFRKVDNMPGAGQFTINRNSDEFVMCATDNLVRVTLTGGGPFNYDSAYYIGAFFIEEGQDTIVSTDEEGGEYVTLSGRTGEVYLERAILDWEAHYADDIVNHPYDKTALTDGQWHFSENIPHGAGNAGSPGGALRICFRNAQAQVPSAIADLAHTFSLNLDSNGDAWENADGQFDIDVGTNYLDILGIMVNGGLWYRFGADMSLDAWDSSQGQDLSGSITFEKGVNIRESGQREIHATRAKSRVLVRGSKDRGSSSGTFIYRWVNEDDRKTHHDDLPIGGIEDEIGARQGFVDYPYSPTSDRLYKAGRKFITDVKNQHDGPPTVGVLDYAGCEAFVDYQVGDTVGIVLPGVDTTGVVHAITLVENEAGNVDPVLEFIGEQWAGDTTTFNTAAPVSDPVGGASVDGGSGVPDSPDITIDETETLLIWWSGTDPTVTDGTLVSYSGSGMGYVNGPASLNIQSTGTSFQYVVVGGTGQQSSAS